MSHDPYPLPAYAANIWLNEADNCLMLAVPAGADETGHTVRIPLDRCDVVVNGWGNPLPGQRGWRVLLDILRERTRSATLARSERTIGTKASPVQYDLDKMLQAFGGKVKRPLRNLDDLPVEDMLKELDL